MELQVLDLPVQDVYGSHWSLGRRKVPGPKTKDRAVYLPARNLLLIAKAAIKCTKYNIGRLALATLKGNPFEDNGPYFYRTLSNILTKSLGRTFQILSPFSTFTKVELIQKSQWLPLELTFSCINPHNLLHCGACNKCAERKKAFALARIR